MAVFPARIYQLLGNKEEYMERGQVFTTKLLESPGYVDPDSLSLKTWQTSLVSPSGSDMSSADLPKSGMMRNGKLFRRQTLVHHILENASGLWPTPHKGDHDESPEKWFKRRDKKLKQGINLHLPLFVDVKMKESGLWPIPWANESTESWETIKNRKERTGCAQTNLTAEAQLRTEDPESARGSLSADWVEWLMGYPKGFTDLDCNSPIPHPGWQTDPADSGETPRITKNQKNRIGRLKCLGNSLVPQITEFIGKRLI